MATVPAPITWVTGSTATAAQLNTNLRDVVNFFLTPTPYAILRQTSAQSVTDATFTSITFGVEDIDRDGGHSTSSNTSRYTAQTSGWFHASGKVGWASNSAGRRLSQWAVNGNAVNGSRVDLPPTPGAAGGIPAAARPIYLNAGDYLELQGYQDSGGSLNTSNATDIGSYMSVLWVST